MSFGGKNPPWQRQQQQQQQQQIPNMTNLQAQAQMGLLNSQIVGFQQNQSQPFHQNLGMQNQQQQQQNMSIMQQNMSQMGGGGNMGNQMQQNQLFTQAVTYPAPRALNPIAFQSTAQQSQMGQSSQLQSNHQHQMHHQLQHQTNVLSPVMTSQQTHSNIQSNLNKNIRVHSGTGLVTKMQNDFGIIDDEIYFHKNVCVKGIIPRIGDRVLVEASYNPQNFKWTATRIQFLSPVGATSNMIPPQKSYPLMMGSGGGGGNIQQKSFNAVPPPQHSHDNNDMARDRRNRQISPMHRNRSPSGGGHSRSRDSRKDDDDADRKRRREERDRDRERHRERDREPQRDRRERDHTSEKRERSPVKRASSLKRRKTRVVPRYMVQIPKVNLTMNEADILELRRRYTNLYIPSDFFFTQMSWVKAFPPNTPFSINKPCSFHIMHKDVINPYELRDDEQDPSDADYLFSAKVMLMSVPHMTEIYQKCFATAEEKERDEDRDFVHPTRLINFLVGIRGKNETMAIGGPWSKSLDGANPESDSSVLIRTAIRNCKALTGIDLSQCTQWYRFVELYYKRSETIHKGSNRVIPARVETVVIFLPEVRSVLPTLLEWDNVQAVYQKTVQKVLNNSIEEPEAAESPALSGSVTAAVADTDSKGVDVKCGTPEPEQMDVEENKISTDLSSSTVGGDDVGAEEKNETDENASATGSVIENDPDGDTTNNKDECKADAAVVEQKQEAPAVGLEPKNMTVADLKEELIARNLSPKGLKAQLVARLSKALKFEAENPAPVKPESESEPEKNLDTDEAMIDAENDLTDMVVIDEYDSTKSAKKSETRAIDDRERHYLEKRYSLPSSPQIIVHPSRTAKSGKFDCTIMSLSLLLDYRPEDTKEHSFEVSLFAELFNEMLMRDFGFNIYKSLYTLPEKPKDEHKKVVVSNGTNEEEVKKKEKSSDGVEKIEPDVEVKKTDDDKSEEKERKSKKGRQSPYCAEDASDDDCQSTKSSERRKTREKERERQKYYTAHLDLLLSFVYFDQTHCGYIFEKDVEDLFYTLGLNLSRSQTRKLVGKIISRDSLYYRKITDLPKTEENQLITEHLPVESDENLSLEIAKGNKLNFPIFKSEELSRDEPTAPVDIAATVDVETPDVPESKTVVYKGGLIDLEKLIEQMKRSDRAREETEKILVELRKENTELSKDYGKSQNKIIDLLSDLRGCNRKLSDAEQGLSSANRKVSDYLSVLSSINDKVAPIVQKAEKNKSESRSHDSSKDKDRDRDQEDKDKHDSSAKHENEVKKEK